MTAGLPHLLILKIFHPLLTGLLIKVWAFDENSLIYFLDLMEVAKVNCIFFLQEPVICVNIIMPVYCFTIIVFY